MDVRSSGLIMIQVLAVVLLLLFPSFTALAQDAPAGKTQLVIPASPQKPAETGVTPLPPAAPTPQTPAKEPAPAGKQPDYSQEAYVIEHYSEAERFEDDGTARFQTDAKIKIVSESGIQRWGQLKVGYDALTDKLDIGYVRVRKADGTVVTAQESAVQDLTFADAPVYTDYHEKHISVPLLRPGDTLEYSFVRTIATPLAPGQFWTSYNFREKEIVLDEQLEINVPKVRQIKLKTKPGYEPTVSEDGDRRIYRWKRSHLQDENESKKRNKAKKPDDDVASVQLTTFKSWQELGAWYANLERERRVPDASVKAEADSLVKGQTTDMARVKALYDYVSRNIRYVALAFGLGRIQPHAASEVLANGYGDCKDKNTLLAALLEAEGFHSTSVPIGSKLKLDPDVPSPWQFDHVITRVPVDGKDIWLDSTPGVAPFRMLSANLRDKQALAIPPEGTPELVRTPADLPFEGFEHIAIAGSVNDTGKLALHFDMTERGDREMVMRYVMRSKPSNRWKDLFETMLQHTGIKGAEVTDLKTSDPGATDDPLHVEFNFKANNYFDWSAPESRFRLPLSIISIPAADEDDDGASKEPIKLNAIEQVTGEVKLTFPPKYTVHAPIGVDVKRDYAEYHSVYKYEAGQLTGKRTLNVLAREVPRERTQDYLAFRRVMISDQSQEARLENQSPSAAGMSSESADDLFSAAVKAAVNGKYQLAIDLLQKVVKLEPKHKQAWDSLGRAYLDLGETDKAIEAIKTQIGINPYSQHAYNNLGLAYERQGKYDDASAQFQKQLEINPLDATAHGSLGGLYLKQKKFTEAVPELEKAADLQPKEPLVWVSLGQAYLGSNQTDKGMAAFEKAISLSPQPVVWNNIAYVLAEQNVQLERASQYADSAINALETRLRDVALDNLRRQDLGTADLLFKVWDTKGYIESKRDNASVAEQWIVPAWQADASGDEAAHLGEISEKAGKRDDAVRYYLMSLASESPSVDARTRLAELKINNLETKIADARSESQRNRTVALNQTNKGTAEFYLLISPAKIEQAKFIKGDDNLKGLADVLQTTNVGMKFPPGAHAHVVRRAVVSCGTIPPAPCTLELLPASKVRSLE